MDSKKIEELLNRYWNCETSLEEEQQLREYFQASTIPDEHKEAATLFRYFNETKNHSAPDLQFDPKQADKRKPKGKTLKLSAFMLRVAAGFAVLIVAGWVIINEIDSARIAEQQKTLEEEEVKRAFAETKKALMMISSNFSKAETEAKKINLFNEAQEEIQKDSHRDM